MKRYNLSGCITAVTAALLLCSPASATVISSFNDRTVWETSTSHAAGVVDQNFNATPSSTTANFYSFSGGATVSGTVSVNGGAATTSTGWLTPTDIGVNLGSGNYMIGGYLGNGSSTSVPVVSTLTVSFASSLYTGVGFDYSAFQRNVLANTTTYASNVTIAVRETGGSFVTVNAPGGGSTWSVTNGTPLKFFGVTTTGNISDIQITYSIPSLNATATYVMAAMDNLVFATASSGGGGGGGGTPLPEPATMLLAGATLLGLGILQRKSRS